MHAKLSMQPVQKSSLSEHEVKRCRAVARGNYWEVWEESIMWWSPDKERWHPVEADVMPRRRRWLVLETEEGFRVALIWNAGDEEFALPARERGFEPLPARERI
ncbi:MAG TPA: hypothetical protein VJN32_01180 [Dehalococcoidia bacterium]|nr:hypothetical protein [Dehalococcoidia bacterium]